MSDVGVMVPILAVGLSLSIPIVGIVSDYRKRRVLIESLHAERMAAIEKGVTPPPVPVELLGKNGGGRRNSTLLPGLVWLFIGLALLGVSIPSGIFDFTERPYIALAGAIPAAVGLALLIYYAVEGRKVFAASVEAERQKPPST